MTNDLIPGDDRRCVWMTAGLVAYKLCDRDFDCERCPFDRALRGASPLAVDGGDAATTRPAAPRRPASWTFPADRRYDPGHTWVSELAGGRVRVGLDGFAARLLGRAAAVILPPPGSRLRAGRFACWLQDGGEPIPIRAPVSGSVVRRNGEVRRRPALATEAPYDDGWLLEIDVDGAGVDRGSGPETERRLLDAGEARARADRQLAELAHRLSGEATAAVGPTLPDGGVPVADLRALLGAERFRRLAASYLT